MSCEEEQLQFFQSRASNKSTSKKMSIIFSDSLPTRSSDIDSLLRENDFEYEEEDSCDSCRWCEYSREIQSSRSNIRFIIILRFELVISDSASGSYDDNFNLFFDEARMEIENWSNESIIPSHFGSYPLNPKNYGEIEGLIDALTY
jgi:hypothetical protein